MFLEWKTSCSWNRNQYHSRHQRHRQYSSPHQQQQQLRNSDFSGKCFVSKKLRKCKLTDQVQNGVQQSVWTPSDRKWWSQSWSSESLATVPVQSNHQNPPSGSGKLPPASIVLNHHQSPDSHFHCCHRLSQQRLQLCSPIIHNSTENVRHLRRPVRFTSHCRHHCLRGQFHCLRPPSFYYSIVSMYWRSSILAKITHSVILLFILISLATCQERSKTLYIAGFFPTSRDIPQGSIGRGVLPAVSLALQHVNESPLFTKYNLDLVWNNTKCDAAYGMQAFFRMLDEKPVKIILFGDACPTVTDPIAKASKFFHLIQLSYADTFTSTTANFFRIVPSEGSFNPARVKLLKFFNWTKVGTIYQNSVLYSLPHSKLLTDLDNAGVDIIASQSIADELRPEMYLQKFKDKDVRIILGNFGEKWGQKIFCQAYKEGMYGRRYQWIITGIYEENWWKLSEDETESLGCSEAQLLEAIDGYIATDVLPLSKNATTYYSFETSIYKSEYDRLRGGEYSRFHGYAYDGIWAIALAIQTVDKKLRMRNSQLTIEDFQYRDPFWANLFREALNETQFDGVTGHVSFDKNERRGIVLLQQFLSSKMTMTDIAQYYTADDKLVFENNHQIDWQGGTGPPVDRNTMVISPSRISITLFIVISVFAIIGIVIAFVFLTMNIKYRNQRYIKMSSPYLNNMIIIGCIFTYTSVILFGLNSGLTSESNFPYICASRAWVLMTGFTLAFGSMFSKTWRVHAIFTDIKLNKKLIKDYKLFMVVGVLVFIDVATLTTWQIVDPFYRATSQGKPEPSPQNEDILVIPEMEYCQSKRMTIFLGSIYVYKGLLMAFGIFLAWETRQVSIPALNDSKYIGMSVYNVVIMCVIGAGLSFVLKDQQDAAFVIISIFIIFCSTATLCLVFVPKLIELKRNPNAGDRRVRATLKPFKTSRRDSEEVEIHTKIKLATDDNFRFRQRLKEKSYELEALTFRLRALKESVKQVKANEIVVEENDLKQLDNCNQRKLSVASVKQLPNNKSRRKSSTANKIISNKIELQEESSPEIVVNSTSIFSLSSEAAQLTVKKGSLNEISSCNSSKSSDEISISYGHQPSRLHNGDGRLSSGLQSASNATGSEPSADQNSISDSDDTSYAKAIQQTINSEVIPLAHMGSQAQSQLPHHCHHSHHKCTARIEQSVSHHQCCHHHHHQHLHQLFPSQPKQVASSPVDASTISINTTTSTITAVTSTLVTASTQSAVQTNSILKSSLKSKQNPLQCNNLKEIDKFALTRTRRTRSFGGFLQHQLHDELVPFEMASPTTSFTITSSAGIRHTSTSPVRTCSSVGTTLNVVDSSTSSASFIRLFPYLNRSISIDQSQQPLRSGQSCPQVRCDIVEYL